MLGHVVFPIMLETWSLSVYQSLMDSTSLQNLAWLVFDWNVRGLNDGDKQTTVYNKIDESNDSIVCLQEAKCASFDHSLIRKFCPKRFN